MTATHRVAAIRYRWTPILTFTRRRLELLEWIDRHLTPLAFLDEPDNVGVAVGTRDTRIEVQREGMTVRATDLGAAAAVLDELLHGVFEVLEPNQVRQRTYSSLWSFALDADDYNERRAEFARDITIEGASTGGFLVLDGSCLVDVESTEWRGQMEYGVVQPGELVQRLENPDLGRVRNHSRSRVHRDAVADLPDLEELPPVSLLVDATLIRRHGGTVSDPLDVLSTMSDASDAMAGLLTGLMKKFRAGGDGNEFAQAE